MFIMCFFSIHIGHYVRRFKGKRRTCCSKRRTCPDVRRLFIYTVIYSFSFKFIFHILIPHLYPSGCIIVCGGGPGETDPRGAHVRVAYHVPAGGGCRALLQPTHAARHPPEDASTQHQRTHHGPIPHTVVT